LFIKVFQSITRDFASIRKKGGGASSLA